MITYNKQKFSNTESNGKLYLIHFRGYVGAELIQRKICHTETEKKYCHHEKNETDRAF